MPTIKCKFCGSDNDIHLKKCSYCGAELPDVIDVESIDGSIINTHSEELDKDLSKQIKTTLYILSLLVGPIGVIMGVVYIKTNNPDKKRFAKNILAIGLVMCFMFQILYLILSIMLEFMF